MSNPSSSEPTGSTRSCSRARKYQSAENESPGVVRDGHTALSLAVESGTLRDVMALVNEGASIETSNENGLTPLHVAAKLGKRYMVDYFLSVGANVNLGDRLSLTPLHHAVKGGHLPVIKALVKSGADCKIGTRVQMMKPIHYAVLKGKRDVVEYLLSLLKEYSYGEAKSEINAVNSEGNTPLLLAAKHNNTVLIMILVEAGADVECANNKRLTVLHYAATRGWIAVVQRVLSRFWRLDVETECGQTPVLMASRRGHEVIVNKLIHYGASLERDTYEEHHQRWTLLHHAAMRGWLEIVVSILSKADPREEFPGRIHEVKYIDEKSKDLETALSLAAKYKHIDIFCVLIRAGADFSQVGNLMHYAAKNGWLDMIKFFVSKKVKVDVKNSRNETPLHFACLYNQISVIEYLLKSGASGYVKNIDNKTPFKLLIDHNKSFEAIKICVANGACLEYGDYLLTNDHNPAFKVGLRSVFFCTDAVINRYNKMDLPALYKLNFGPGVHLPPMKQLMIVDNQEIYDEVKRKVTDEIQAKGLCNVNGVWPKMLLSVMCVQTLLKNSKPGMKRIADDHDEHYPSKNRRLN